MNKATKKRLFLISVSVLLIIIASLSSVLFQLISGKQIIPGQRLSSKTLTVKFIKDGFGPKELDIQKGDSVVFVNETDKSFWPASDLHPTHTIYPEFDPKQPIEPGNSWTFKFNKEGSWKYHDHLFPYYRGVIRVSVKTSSKILNLECNDFSGGQDKLKLQCWDRLIEHVLSTKGIAAAFEIVSDRYKNDQFFAKNCHIYTHKIGEETYKKFKNNENFDIPAGSTTTCGFGFYHGFMEALHAISGDLIEAQKFCDFAKEKFSGQKAMATVSCFHGIGHGLVDFDNIKNWGNEKTALAPAMEVCNKIARNSLEIYGCSSGMFNALSIAYVFDQYNMKIRKDDPYWICRDVPDKFQPGCYNDMNVAIWKLTEQNLTKSGKHAEAIQKDELAIGAIQGISSLDIRESLQHTEDFTSSINACKGMQKRLQEACITGLIMGFFEFGEPQKEYVKALVFCESTSFSPTDKETCYKKVLTSSRTRYGVDKLKQICSSEVKPAYKQYCQ